jgi:peptidylprolyl isomerase
MKLASALMGLVLLTSILGTSCGEGLPKKARQQKKEAEVVIQTDAGDIGIVLYPETPIHRENFLKLAREGFYDSLNFHRVIKGFMVQTGDPSTRTGDRSQPNGPGYTLEAEIVDKYVHTRGKLGAARLPDYGNPERRSAGSQFYIVTGKLAGNSILDSMANERTKVYRGNMYEAYNQLPDSQKAQLPFDTYLEQQNFEPYRYTEEQRNRYLNVGGAPHLDFTYTIFGEVVFGMDVVQEIEAQITNNANRPVIEPIRIQSMQIVADSAAAALN